VQRLQQAGYADRVPDPGDRRAQLIQLTPAGRAASTRIREAGTSGCRLPSRTGLRRSCTSSPPCCTALVDDFLAYTAEEECEQPAR
jgi:DNA-binding MarR family transcriptional regulator